MIGIKLHWLEALEIAKNTDKVPASGADLGNDTFPPKCC
jgi:hypothetical protein